MEEKYSDIIQKELQFTVDWRSNMAYLTEVIVFFAEN